MAHTHADAWRAAFPALMLVAVAEAASGQSSGGFLGAPWIGFDTGAYPEGYRPLSSVMSDFNGDGRPDLAVVGRELAILLGDGAGGFLTPQTVALPLQSWDVVAGDFDNDGDADLVLTDTGAFREGRTVSWYDNDGEAGFTLRGSFSTGNDAAAALTAADFNGDGFLDVAVAHDRYIEYANSAAVLLNNAGAGFQSPILIGGLAVGTQNIASGDVDGDGDPDLAVAHKTNRWTLVRNDGGSSFVPQPAVTGVQAGSIPEQPAIQISDVDNDADLDVIFSNIDTGGQNSPGGIGLWRNNGDGSFAAGQFLSFGAYTNGGVDILVHDVNQDGWPDILAATDWSGYWFTLAGDGTGGFLAARGNRGGDSPIRVYAGDVDGDTDQDVVAMARDSFEACVHLNPGDGVFPQPALLDMGSPALHRDPTNLNAADLDGDGDLDLVSGSSEPGIQYQLVIRRNNGDGSFGPRETYTEVDRPSVIQLGDINGDDALDIVWIDHNSRLRARLNLGDGTLGDRLSMHVLQPDRHYFELHDVDNDGDLDVVTPGFFEVYVLKNSGTGSFAPPLKTYLDTWFGALAMGDFNEDGVLDLLINGGEQGYPRICIGVGDGTFELPNTVPTGRAVTAFAIEDFNGDGDLDFAASFHLDGGGLSIRLGRGDGTFWPHANYPGSYDEADPTSSLDLRDLDGDGVLDAVVANVAAQELSVWTGNPDGSFNPVQRIGVAQNAFDVECGDFTGDDLIDAAVMCQADVLGVRHYPAVVLLRGDPGGSAGPEPAELTDYAVQFGQYISGDLESLRLSDDNRLRMRSRPGFTATEANLIELRIGSATSVQDAEALDLSIEGLTNQPGGTMRVRLRNWTTNAFQQVHQYAIGSAETTEVIPGLSAANRVRASDGRIEVSLRASVFATFSAQGFDALIDQVGVFVE